MTSSYKAVFIASALITLSLFFIIMNSGSQNQAPTFFWAMTVWYMYKHDYQASVTLQKIMMGFSGLATMAFAIGSFQEDKTISNLLGFSPYEMIIPGLISFCVHFWLLGFFQNTLSVDLKNKVRASYTDPEISKEQEPQLVQEPLPESKTSSWLDSFVNTILIVPPVYLAGAWLISLDKGGPNPLGVLIPTMDNGATWFTVLWPFALIYWLVNRTKTKNSDLKNYVGQYKDGKKVSASYIDPMDDNVTSEGSDKVRDSQEIGFDIWEMASEEYDNNRNTGIWAMAFAESEGNEDKAKALYLKTRAEQLANDFDQKTFEEDISSSETDSQYIEDPSEEVEEDTSSSEAGRVKISAILERYQYIEDPSETENVEQHIEDPSETENVEQTIPVTQNYDALMKSENRKNRGHDLWVVVVVVFWILVASAIVINLG